MAEKILIIDDDIDTLKLVGLMLERQGYQIAVASNGTIGLSKASSERPDLILLDVMMPDMDGYQVTERLRSDPSLSHIPIVMFTAKTMVDDKVKGFESGVDDYLTKPTHPAELTAHVKAVLSRSISAPVKEAPEQAQIVSFFGTRAGLGTSTLALNVGVQMQLNGLDVIVAEMNPGRGSLALALNISAPTGLTTLLSRSLKDIHLRSVESEVVTHPSGVRLLLASYQPREGELEEAVSQMEAVVKNLASMCTALVLDLGSGLRPYSKPLLLLSESVIVVVEPVYPSNVIARAVLDDLFSNGLQRGRTSLALITRERTSLNIPWKQVEADLGIALAGIVSPAPELVQQASQSGNPLIIMHRDTLTGDQIRKMTEAISSKLALS
ncbi:MAG: response regulator [Chloroflexota bacterium]